MHSQTRTHIQINIRSFILKLMQCSSKQYIQASCTHFSHFLGPSPQAVVKQLSYSRNKYTLLYRILRQSSFSSAGVRPYLPCYAYVTRRPLTSQILRYVYNLYINLQKIFYTTGRYSQISEGIIIMTRRGNPQPIS